MRCHAHAWLTVAVSLTILALLLSGCGARSDTTSSGHSSAPGLGPTSSSSASATSTTSPATPGAATTPAGTGPSALTISPTVGSARAVIGFSFTAPSSSGPAQATQTSYSLTVLGPRRSGCVGMHGAALPATRAGARVTVDVGPAQLGGPWCAGTFTARVQELIRPVCTPGTMCPQFIRVAAVIGPRQFRITG